MLLWVPKIGHKLLLGKKSTPMVIKMSQSGKRSAKRTNPRSGDLSIKYRVFNGISCFHHLLYTLAFKVVIIFFK